MNEQIERHYSLAGMYIAEGEWRIKQQEALLAKLTTAGRERKDATMLLATFHRTLDAMRAFQRLAAMEMAARQH